jgi:hypothetical protein
MRWDTREEVVRTFAALWLKASVAIALGVGLPTDSSAETIKAPFDSYVCYDASMADCIVSVLNDPQPFFSAGRWKVDVDGTMIMMADASLSKSSNDKVQCTPRVGKGYAFKFNFLVKRQVVFFSPDLFLRFGEALQRLEQASLSCRQLADRYDLQIKKWAKEIDLESSHASVQAASAELEAFNWRLTVERESNYCYNLPTDVLIADCRRRAVMPTEASGSGATLTVGSIAASSKRRSVEIQLMLRAQERALAEFEFVSQAQDLSLSVETATRDVYRTMIAIDASVLNLNGDRFKRKAESNSQVERGAVVLTYRKR